MSNGAGSTKDLNESRAQALQALFNSITPGGTAENGQNIPLDQVRKISDRLGELLGDGEHGFGSETQKRNEKGELVNEEGLPIIDIVEPITGAALKSEPVHIFDDPDLLPPWALSPAEKARRRAERERVLDLLEEEEGLVQEREEVAERERWQFELEKRKEAAKVELDALRKAKELQKKMGKALLRNVIDAKEREEKEAATRAQEEGISQERKRNLKPKKSVTFADLPPDRDEEVSQRSSEDTWGDVSLAKLRTKGRTTLLTKAQMDKGPMKMQVVERHPASSDASQLIDGSRDRDSDDESVPGSPVPADSDEGELIHSDYSTDEADHAQPLSVPPDSDSEGTEYMSDDEPVHWQEDDLDFAQHQREIALAYYEKRAAIGAETSSAMRAHSHDEVENEWDQPEVPLAASLASAPPKATASRFKTERASTLASHSLGPSVLPSSQSSTLKSAVRMGKLEDDRLIGGESDDDNEEEARAIVELLTRGDVTNIGPQPDSSSAGRARHTTGEGSAGSLTPASAATGMHPAQSQGNKDEQPSRKPSRVSKFKLALTRPHEEEGSTPLSPAMETPLSTLERSSPKLASPGPGTPILVPSSSYRPSTRELRSSFASTSTSTPDISGTQAPRITPPNVSIASSLAASSIVIDSPSFLPPRSPSTIIESPSFQSVVFESATFPSSASTVVSSPSLPSPSAAPSANAVDVNPQKATRPTVVMSAEVKEARPPRPADSSDGPSPSVPEKKVSRCLAERV